MSILKLFAAEKITEVIEKDIQKFESVIKSDLHSIFAQAKKEAAAANAEVEKLKTQLALAIKDAADKSQKAADAAKAAADEAAADAAALVNESQTHAAIAAAQASQIVVTPVTTPVVDPAPVVTVPQPDVTPTVALAQPTQAS
jgi:hypothetical protein